MTEDEASEELRAWLAAVDADASLIDPARAGLAGVTISHQRGPRPSGAYAMVTHLSDRDMSEVDHQAFTAKTIATEERIVEDRTRGLERLYRVDVFAPTASEVAGLFVAALRSHRAQIGLGGMKVRRVKTLDIDPKLIGEGWEGRAAFDVEIADLVTQSVLIDVIEQVTVETTALGTTERTDRETTAVSQPAFLLNREESSQTFTLL